MSKPIVFKSNASGDLRALAEFLKDRPETVSVTFDDGFDFTDKSEFKVYVQAEPPEVMAHIHKTEFPQVKQTTFQQLIENHGFYDLILAWHPEVLAHCSNAILFPHCHGLDDNYDLSPVPDKESSR